VREEDSRDVPATAIVLDAVRSMKMRRGGEEGHKDVDAPEFSANDWPMIYDRASIEEWLLGRLPRVQGPTGKEDTLGLHFLCKGLWRWSSVEMMQMTSHQLPWQLLWYSTRYMSHQS